MARIAKSALAWDAPVSALRGLGTAAAAALAKHGIACAADLVWTRPVGFDDARHPATVEEAIARAEAGQGLAPRVCVAGVVKSAGLVPMRGRRSARVVVVDASGATLHAWWFFAAHGVLAIAKVGTRVLLTGRVRVDPEPRASGRRSPPRMAHPDLAIDTEASRVVRARYPRLGVAEATVRTAIGAALDAFEKTPDAVPEMVAAREAFPPAEPLLRGMHGSAGVLDAPPSEAVERAFIERLAWGEAFARVWGRIEAEAKLGANASAAVLPQDPQAIARLKEELGFALTLGQTQAIETIARELALPDPMRRLLLGDVGTGKTAVALAAAAQCVRAGWQVALLAPTTVLAEQTMDAAAPLVRATGARIACVTAGLSAAERRRATLAIAEGNVDVAIGTHALLGAGIAFARLGLVVVDEQQRLGVAQRLALVQKGAARPHLLTLSATPIPRTLALALRGELKTSHLEERPKGRPPVATSMRSRSELSSIEDELRAVCVNKERAFVVAPRIEDGEDDDAENGVKRLERALAAALAPHRVALVHGSLAPAAKLRAMRAFRSGEAQVLVATTVIEVGVDVPEATLMVVLNAERFGLAQLHQLRGRVGRGDRPGRCVLVHDEPLDARAEARLQALCTLSAGVEIAKADLELRGAGDLSGTRQSGDAGELMYLDPADPPRFLAHVEEDARRIFAEDPELSHDAHRVLALSVRRLAAAIAMREEAG